MRLEPNVTEVAAFLQKSLALLGELEGAARWRELAAQASGYRQLAGELRERRPDVADAIDHAMAAFFTAERALARSRRCYERDGAGQGSAGALIEAFGPAVVPACVGPARRPGAAGEEPVARDADVRRTRRCSRRRSSQELAHCGLAATARGRQGARVCRRWLRRRRWPNSWSTATNRSSARRCARSRGSARRTRPRSSRDSCRTATRAAAPRPRKRCGISRRRAAAALVRELLGNREFVVQHPATVCTLLDRAAKAGIDGLDSTTCSPSSSRCGSGSGTRARARRAEGQGAARAMTTAPTAAALPGRSIRCPCSRASRACGVWPGPIPPGTRC